MDIQDTKTTTTIESETAVKIEEEVQRTTTEENCQKPNEAKERGSVEDFVRKALEGKELGSKFTTQNDGNVEKMIIFNIDKMMGDISSVQKEETATKIIENIRQYKLNERQECSDFVSEYKSSLHLAYAIVISMFEYVPVSDLQKLSESLLRRFPKTFDVDGKEIMDHISPFISLDTILSIISAQTGRVSFESRFENIKERCVYFEKVRDKVMENLWDLFPMLRSEITSWLIEINFSYSYKNAFSTSCFVKALSNIVKLDFGDSINRLFPQLTSREENKYLMIRLMLLLVEDKETRKNACEILRQWAISPKWLWEISLVVYSISDEELPITNELERIITRKILDCFDEDWEDWNIQLIGGQMVNSLRLRNLVSRILHKLTMDTREKSEYAVSVIYLLTISSAYQFIDKDDMALPMVAVDSKRQVEDIEALLYKLFSDFALRHGLFEVLKAYLEEINEYNITERLLNQLKGYFYVIAKKSTRFHGDIRRFLLQLQAKGNKTAGAILSFLQDKLSSSKELVTV